MHASDTLHTVLSRLPRVTLHGPWSRAVGFHLLTSPPPGAAPGTPPQPLWSGGAKQRGARFTPQHGFDSLYLATDPITALTEVVAVFQPSRGPLVALKTNPWVVVTVEGVLHDIVDLTNPDVQRELGTSVQELTGDWSYAQSTVGIAETQRLGEAGYASQDILGFKFPSAKNTGKGDAIVIFAGRLVAGQPSFVEIFDPHHNLSQRLP
jgi:RES domain-containing protein